MFTREVRREIYELAHSIFGSWSEYAVHLAKERENPKEIAPGIANALWSGRKHILCIGYLTHLVFNCKDFAGALRYIESKKDKHGKCIIAIPDGAISLALTLRDAGILPKKRADEAGFDDPDTEDPFGGFRLFELLQRFAQEMLSLSAKAREIFARTFVAILARFLRVCPAFGLSSPRRRKPRRQRHLEARFIVAVVQPGFRRHPASIAERRNRTGQRRFAIGLG